MRICLAGAENRSSLEALLKAEAPNLLMSYFYLRKQGDRGRGVLERAKGYGAWIIVDSGAHTFFVKYPWLDPRGGAHIGFTAEQVEDAKQKFLKKHDSLEDALGDIDDYMKEYIAWANEMGDLFDACAELDIDALVGYDKVLEWRDWWRESGFDIDKLVVTLHYGGDPEWKKMCAEYKFVALAGGSTKQEYEEYFTNEIQTMSERKVFCHGWAMTNLEAITQLPFYSVDSTSWLMGAKFGITYEYGGSMKMKTYDSADKDVRKRFLAECKENDIDHDLLLADKSRQVNEWNALQWAKYSRDMLTYNTNAYWLSQEERNAETAEARAGFRTELAVVRHDTTPMKVEQHPTLGYARFCNTCFLQTKCPVYEADSTCNLYQATDIADGKDLQNVMMKVMGIQTDRVMFAAMAEKVSGSSPDERVSKEMQNLFGLAKTAKDVFDMRDEVTIKAKGTGLIAKLFGGYGKAGQANPAEVRDAPDHTEYNEVIDVEPGEDNE